MSYEDRIPISKKDMKELRAIPENEKRLIEDRISKFAYFPFAHLDVKKLKNEGSQTSSWLTDPTLSISKKKD